MTRCIQKERPRCSGRAPEARAVTVAMSLIQVERPRLSREGTPVEGQTIVAPGKGCVQQACEKGCGKVVFGVGNGRDLSAESPHAILACKHVVPERATSPAQ